MHYVVYIGNSRYLFFFFVIVCSCFSENNRITLVLLFLFFTLECIVATSFDKFELQCQKRLSQVNVIVPVRLKFKLYAVFIQRDSWIIVLFMRGQDIVNNWAFPPRFPDTATKGWYRKLLFDMFNEKKMFLIVSLRDRLDCLENFVGMTLLVVLFLLPCLPYAFGSHPPTAPFHLLLPSPSPKFLKTSKQDE